MSGIIGQAGTNSGIIPHGGIDYEEGTWTPTLSADYGFSTGGTYTGNYTRIGDLVTLDCLLDFDSSETYVVGDRFIMQGLPYVPIGNVGLVGSGAMVQGGSWSGNNTAHGITSINTAGVAELCVYVVNVNSPPNLDNVQTNCSATYIV